VNTGKRTQVQWQLRYLRYSLNSSLVMKLFSGNFSDRFPLR